MCAFREISIEKAHELKQRPSLLEVESELKLVKKISWILSISLTFFFIILWPLIMVMFGDYDVSTFKFWIIIGQIFVFLSFAYSVFGPLLENIYKKYIKTRFNAIDPSKQKFTPLSE